MPSSPALSLRPRVAILAIVTPALAVAACAAGASNSGGSFAAGPSGSSTSVTTSGSSTGGLGGAGGSTTTASGGLGGSFTTGSTASGSGSSSGVTYAYAHTNTALYQFDPSQSTLSMQLVGNFDCIGSGSSSSSSSGSALTCTQVGKDGCCDGNTEYYCSSGTVSSKKCSGSDVCGWSTQYKDYECVATAGTPPSGSPPMACPTPSTSSSSSSSGTTVTRDSSMTDLAVDSKGNLWGVSEHNAYELTIQGSTVHCAKTIPLTNTSAVFYALSFVPEGIIDASSETLLAGDTNGDLWRIDTTTGAVEQHGNFGTVPSDDGRGHNYPSSTTVSNTVGTPWQLSGDIVFLAASGSSPAIGFATVRDCTPSTTTCSPTDTLIEIDPTKLGTAGTPTTANVTLGLRGQVVKSSTCTDTTNATYGAMYGIASWNSTIYGFSHDSYVVEISNVDGTACAVAGTNTSEAWSGAAVTTIAPVKVPPPPPVQ